LRCDELDRVAKGCKFSRPEMRAGARFHPDKAWWQVRKVCSNVRPLQLTAYMSVRSQIDGVARVF
jgi:hypothetical protein